MKVALVIPTYSYTSVYPSFLAMCDFPVGIAYIAGAIKNAGHEVIGLNPNNFPGYASAREMLYVKMKRMLETQSPQLIGLGGLCTDYAFIRDTITICRNIAPNIPIVCGGGIITHDSEFVFNLLKPDFCIIGEGEESIVRLINCLEAGGNFTTVPNLGFWLNGVATFTAINHNYSPLETYVFPDYTPFDAENLLANSPLARWYYRGTRLYPRIVPFVAARGCPFKCTFCVHTADNKYRTRPMSDILKEIGWLYDKYNFNVLIILDELFAIDKKRLQEFCHGIMEGRKHFGWDFDWAFQTHANANLGFDELMMAKEAGCYLFSYGLESASPIVLESMKKKTRPEQISTAMRLSKDVGIGIGGNFIFGDIAETPDTIAESMDFFLENCIDAFCFFTPISPYPGSMLFEYCLQHNIILDKYTYYETIDTVIYNMTSMSSNEYIDWIKNIVYPMNEMPYGIVVEASEVILDSHPREDSGLTPFWLIKSRCPHCSVVLSAREPLSEQAVASGNTIFQSFCYSCGKRFRILVKIVGCNETEYAKRFLNKEELKSIIINSLRPLGFSKNNLVSTYEEKIDSQLYEHLKQAVIQALDKGDVNNALNLCKTIKLYLLKHSYINSKDTNCI